MEEYTKKFKIDIPQKQKALKAEIVSFLNSTDGEIYSCGGFNTPTLCVVTKGIKADCNHLMRTTYPDAFVGVVDLESDNAMTADRLKELLNVSKRTVERDIEKLRKDNKIEYVGSAKDGRWIVKAKN